MFSHLSCRASAQGFRDAIKAHKSLFLNRKILHREVSVNNIILTDPKQTGGLSGMLIDFDLAVTVDEGGKNERIEEQVMTGTLEFIAIEILEGALRKDTSGIEHTCRHDLESFFYVFLSVCIRYGWDDGKAPNQNPLREASEHFHNKARPYRVWWIRYTRSQQFRAHVRTCEGTSEDVAGHPVLERGSLHWHSSATSFSLRSDYRSL